MKLDELFLYAAKHESWELSEEKSKKTIFACIGSQALRQSLIPLMLILNNIMRARNKW